MHKERTVTLEIMGKEIVEFKNVVKTYGSGEALQYTVNHIDFTMQNERAERGRNTDGARIVECMEVGRNNNAI